MLAYLSGSIEFAGDKGKRWRRALKPFLEETLRHKVYDPAEDEKKNLTDEEVAHFRRWKTTDLDRFRQAVRKIIHYDLDCLQNQADYVIGYWNHDAARGAGTQAELTAAYRKGIPVYLVTELPVEEISGWILGCADRVFASFEELKTHLLEIYGKRPPSEEELPPPG